MNRLATASARAAAIALAGALSLSSPAPADDPAPDTKAMTQDATPAADWRDFDRLWNYNDPAATEDAFRALLPDAEASGDDAKLAELLSQIARTHSLRRQFDAAHPILDRAESLLAAGEPSRARVRVLLERGRCFNSAGDKANAAPLFLEAYEMAVALKEESLGIDAAHMMGIVETAPEEQLAWSMKALALAEASADPKARGWAGSLLNNIGWSLHDAGRFDEALDHFQRALAFRQAQPASPGNDNATRIAKWAVARAKRSLGRLDEALAEQQALLAEHAAAGSNDGYVHEELGELLLLLNRTDEARPHFAKAYELLSKDEWLVQNEGERVERLKRLGEGGE